MSDFDDQFASQAAQALLDQFGESIVYVPKGGSSRVIELAIVDRNPPALVPGPSGQLVGHMLHVTVLDGPTGISLAELETGGANADELILRPVKDGPEKRLKIGKVLESTGGMLRLEIR